MSEFKADSFVLDRETWGVCGELHSKSGMDDRGDEWRRAFLVRHDGVGRLYMRAIPDPGGRFFDPAVTPEVTAHTRALLAAAAPCMYRLLRDIAKSPQENWSREIRNVLGRAMTGRGYYYRGYLIG